MIKVAINGFGRIGRTLTRVFQGFDDIELVAVNDLADIDTLAHLLKYDSIHRQFPNPIVRLDDQHLKIGNNTVRFTSESNPEKLDWQSLDVDVLLEATGKFKSREAAQMHRTSGAKKVIITAPPAGDDIKTIVIGVNDHLIDASDTIISNASCTTNSAAPLVHILNENWGIESAYITTVHSYTTDQRLHDTPHKDLRRARAAGQSIVPTTTGAAKALTKIFPELDGKIGGAGIRVPVPNGSLTDLSCVLRSAPSIAEINEVFRQAAEGKLKGIMAYNEEPIVSIDIIDNPHSCIFDSELTSALGNMVKVVGWYDNEWGYSTRLAELTLRLARTF